MGGRVDLQLEAMEFAKRYKVAILVNIIAPYRVPIYQEIGQVFDTHLFYSGEERNRAAWQSMRSKVVGLSVKRSWGVTLSLLQHKRGKVFDYKFLHINPGYFVDLFRFRPHAIVTTEMGFRTLAAMLYGTIFHRPVWVWWGARCILSRT